MKNVIEQQTTTLNYSAGQTSTLPVGAKSYWIVGMLLDVELAKTDSASPTTYQDFLYRSMTGITMRGGGRTYLQINAPDLRALYWGTRMRLHGRGRAPDMQAGSVTFRHQLPILFGVNPVLDNDRLNLFDDAELAQPMWVNVPGPDGKGGSRSQVMAARRPTAGIAPDQDLTLQIAWAANTAIGANRTVGAATLVRVTFLGVVPESQDEEPTYFPYWVSNQWQPSQNYAGKSGTINLPTGYYYRRSHLLFVNGTAGSSDNRTDGMSANAVSEIGVKTADGRFPLDMKTWDFTQRSQSQFQVADDNAAVPGATLTAGAAVVSQNYNAGVGSIDWAQLADTSKPAQADPLYGINLVSKQVGAVQLAFTVDANTNTSVIQLHECYAPYQ